MCSRRAIDHVIFFVYVRAFVSERKMKASVGLCCKDTVDAAKGENALTFGLHNDRLVSHVTNVVDLLLQIHFELVAFLITSLLIGASCAPLYGRNQTTTLSRTHDKLLYSRNQTVRLLNAD